MSARPSLSRIGSLMQYIRMAYANYVAFLLVPFATINTTYLVLDRQGINVDYLPFASLTIAFGTLGLLALGLLHYKGGLYAGQMNVDVLNNPWYHQAIPGKEKDVALPITLLTLHLIATLIEDKAYDEYREDIAKATKQLQQLIDGGSV